MIEFHLEKTTEFRKSGFTLVYEVFITVNGDNSFTIISTANKKQVFTGKFPLPELADNLNALVEMGCTFITIEKKG